MQNLGYESMLIVVGYINDFSIAYCNRIIIKKHYVTDETTHDRTSHVFILF